MGGGGAEAVAIDEQALARGAALGDQQAFAAIVERFKGPVYGLCRRYVPGPDAEDLAQDTFVRAFVHRERFDPERPLLPWLLTIARHRCIDHLRRRDQRQRPEPDMSAVADRSVGVEQAVASRQQLRLLARALEGLAEGPREAIVLYHLDGLSYRELAEVLDVPIGTVMTWLHRGRKRLREAIEEDGAPTGSAVRAESGGK
jgi:RNA polymerase sigma-70 factor (ECF subfamily)